MDMRLKQHFEQQWERYFAASELPIGAWFTDTPEGEELHPPKDRHFCVMGEFARVRAGDALCMNASSLTCMGAKRYLGYSDTLRPNFEYFLSCGNDQMKGERYVRTPEMVREWLAKQEFLPLHQRFLHLRRWDALREEDAPQLLIFFATPDLLSGLFTWFSYCNFFDDSVRTPFGAGCNTVFSQPLLDPTRAFIGMFDPTARPYIPKNMLTFSFAFERFAEMVDAMDQCFLTTDAWKRVQGRLE